MYQITIDGKHTQPLIENPDGQTYLIVNSDLNNTIYLGSTQGITSSDTYNAVPLSPQSYLVVDGSEEVWAICAPGKTAILFLVRGGLSFFQSGISGAQLIINSQGLFFYSTVNPTFGKLILSVVPDKPISGSLNVPVFADNVGNAVLPGTVSYFVAGTATAISLDDGSQNVMTAAGPGQLTPWTVVGTIGTDGTNLTIGGGSAGLILSSGGAQARAAGTTIDLVMYGGSFAFIPASGSPETYPNTTLTTSPNLQVTGLIPGAIYKFELNVIYDGAGTNGGLKWNVATDGTGFATQVYEGTTGAQVTNADAFPLSGHSANTNAHPSYLALKIVGLLSLPANSTGAVAMQFAQNTSSSTSTKLYGPGTYMLLERKA